LGKWRKVFYLSGNVLHPILVKGGLLSLASPLFLAEIQRICHPLEGHLCQSQGFVNFSGRALGLTLHSPLLERKSEGKAQSLSTPL
jgi:hypothetical protein